MHAHSRSILVLLAAAVTLCACRSNRDRDDSYDSDRFAGRTYDDHEDFAARHPNTSPSGEQGMDVRVRESSAPIPPEDPNHFGRTSDYKPSKDQLLLDSRTILGLLIAVDDHEMLAAMAAEQRTLPEPVEAYARMLHSSHAEHQAQTMQLARKLDIVPAEDGVVDVRRADATKELAHLTSLDNHEFPRAYMVAMINGHEKVLRDIDELLLPAAKNDELRAHLKSTREAIASHLEEGRRVQKSLPK
jgi:putative membrane protein